MPPKRNPKVDNTIFELKVQSKLLEKQAAKAKKKENEERAKIKGAIEKGNDEGARIYAENAIREKNTGLQYLRMAAKLDGVSSRLNVMQITNNIMGGLDGMNKALEAASKSVDLNKYNEILNKFGENMDNIEDRNEIINNKLEDATGSTINNEDVDALINNVRQEYNLKMNDKVGSLAGPVNVPQQQQQLPQQQQQQLLQPMGMGGGGYQPQQPSPQQYQQPPPQQYQQPPPQQYQQPPPQQYQQPPPQQFQQPSPQQFQQPPPQQGADDDLQSRLDRLMRNQ